LKLFSLVSTLILKYKILLTLAAVLASLFLITCNPFAPELDKDIKSGSFITGDQRSIEGLFQNFKYAYTFKDTLLYGKLLNDEFTFLFRNYDKGIDETWGRDEEMQITNRLFLNSQNLDLIWNEIFSQSGDSTEINVIRYFNLTITFNINDIIRIDGKVNLTLFRGDPNEVWKIKSWRDESNY
jgi:hypothetical protein